MTKLELLEQFFAAWQELQTMPKTVGRPGPERQAAADLVHARAEAVLRFKADAPAAPSAELADYRRLRETTILEPAKVIGVNGKMPVSVLRG